MMKIIILQSFLPLLQEHILEKEDLYRQQIKQLVEKHIPGANVFDPVEHHPNSMEYNDEKGSSVFFDLMARAGFDPRQTVRNRVIDCLVVANFEVQECVIFEAAPVPAIQRISTNEVQRPGNVLTIAFCHDQ